MYVGDLKRLKTPQLGHFFIRSGRLVATDPCYNWETCCEWAFPALNGRWLASILVSDEGAYGNRVAELRVSHETFGETPLANRKWFQTASFETCVDSGQSGFFDVEEYQKVDENDAREPWRTAIFNAMYRPKTDDDLNGIVIRGGAACFSGFGDGCYPVQIARDPSGYFALSAKTIFICEEEDEEDWL